MNVAGADFDDEQTLIDPLLVVLVSARMLVQGR
jgi:hypothetical protein